MGSSVAAMTADSSGGSAQTAAQQATQQIANLAGDTFQQAGSTMEQAGSGQSGGLPADWQSRLLPGENPLAGRARLLKAQKSSAFGGYTSLPGEATATQQAGGAIGQGVSSQSTNQGTSYTMNDSQSTVDNAMQNNINNSSLENNMVNTAVGTAPSQVGDTSSNMEGGAGQNNFSPQAKLAGMGIYGSENERQKSLYARQHGLNPANQSYSRDTYRGNPNWASPWSLKNPLINTF